MRKRIPGYITGQSSNEFGLDVRVQRQAYPNSEFYSSGDPVPEGQPATNENLDRDVRFRNVIPPGEIGSEATQDLDILTPPQFVDTANYEDTETRNPAMHGAMASLRNANPKGALEFQGYATFTPRRAPIPCAGQDEGFLRMGVADPLMTEATRTVAGDLDRTVYGKELYGPNEAGVLHNQGHPGFAAVQKKIQGEGYSKASAGAILASASRNASGAAKKRNPRLNRVKG